MVDFSFYDAQNNVVKLSINKNDNWVDKLKEYEELNSIFLGIDDGDGVVQEDELTYVKTIFNYWKNKLGENILANNSLQNLSKWFNMGKISIQNNEVIDNTQQQKEIVFDNEAEFVTSGAIEIQYKLEDCQKMAQNPEYKTELENKHIEKIKTDLNNKYPSSDYEIEVFFDGRLLRYSVFKNNASVNQKPLFEDNVLSLSQTTSPTINKIKDIQDPMQYMKEHRASSGGATIYSELLLEYKNNLISKEEFLEALKLLTSKFDKFENEYKDSFVAYNGAEGINHLEYYGNSYQRVIDALESIENNDAILKSIYELDDITQEQVFDLQKYIKEEFDIELNELEVAKFISLNKFYDEATETSYCDIEKLKQKCKTGKFSLGLDFQGFIKDVIKYNHWDTTLESIDEIAQIIETEYNKYDFDINTSKIGDLCKKSENLIKYYEENLEITKTESTITMQDKNTGETRVIDINKLTKNLNSKSNILDSLSGMNNLMLWEMAIEIQGSLMDNARLASAGEYDLKTDTISVNNTTNQNSLSHEVIHALMASIVNGKNTFREELYKELAETFEKERNVYRYEKNLSRFGASGYNYCADNINEFAAEAGLLYLSGDSGSKFTIAEHFPNSYRLLVQLIDKIREEKDNRSLI